jgi:hypothetical protein
MTNTANVLHMGGFRLTMTFDPSHPVMCETRRKWLKAGAGEKGGRPLFEDRVEAKRGRTPFSFATSAKVANVYRNVGTEK